MTSSATAQRRWVEVTPSPFPHEAEGLAHIRALLPNAPPFRAWSNVEFRDGQGKWSEVDLLLLGRRRLHLIELKYYSGELRGDDLTWLREGHRPEDSPLRLARRKAQRLAGRLRDELFRWAQETGTLIPDWREALPFVQESVYLHHPGMRCLLPLASRGDLFGQVGLEKATWLPGIAERILEAAEPIHSVGAEQERIVRTLLKRIGLVQRRQREVGSWVIDDEPLADGDGYQDWPAFHRVAMTDRARIRFFITTPGAPAEQTTRTRRLVEHEHRLMTRLGHDGLLKPIDLVENELGVGLVYPEDERYQRLDLWLAQHQGGVAVATQIALIRQVAETLVYAHRHRVVHRGLVPAAVRVRDLPDGAVRALVGDWQTAGVVSGGTSTGLGTTRLPHGGGRTALGDAAGHRGANSDRRLAEAFQAPEGLWAPTADRVRLDIFALGALAYTIVAGRPPAADRASLRTRLQQDHGLDLAADLPQVPAALRTLVLEATRPTVSDRLADARLFLERLADVERDLADPDEMVDPLEAAPGTVLEGRFRLERRLGRGSTAEGLLVTDLRKDGDGDVRRVLKVANDDAAAQRLDDEAAVLAGLDHPRLVRLIEGPLTVGDRTALLLSSAGEETLAEALRARPRLSLDLLERWGTDLLEALVALDRAGITHRDIKPANLGVLEGRGDRVKHLVLFDLSLARAAAGSLTAGTPPYLDPFLGAPGRDRYDSAAERYAAAVVLFEMATGAAPAYGDGLSDPSMTEVEATIDPAELDPSTAPALTAFFRIALARDARMRHDTAGDMLAAWQAVFAAIPRTVHDDATQIADAAEPKTPLVDAGLSPRALSAVEPLGISTAGELAALEPARLSVLPGVAEATRRELRERVRAWRERFAASIPANTPVAAGERPDPLTVARLLLDRIEAPDERAAARLLLGLEGDLDPFATEVQLADAVGADRSRVAETSTALQQAWSADELCGALLDAAGDAARVALERLHGVASVGEMAAAVRAAFPEPESVPVGQDVLRVVVGLVGRGLDRPTAADVPAVVLRRHGDGRVALLATDATLLDAAEAAAERADELVAALTGDLLIPGLRAAGALRAGGNHLGVLDDTRLVALAASVSRCAAVSGRGELHSRDLTQADAVRIALAGLAATQPVLASEVRDRVHARFPALALLPERPRLDAILAETGLPLLYDETLRTYRATRAATDTGGLSTRQTTVVPSEEAAADIDGRVGQRLADSIASRSFLALGVIGDRMDRAADVLARRYGTTILDLTRVLIEGMKEEAQRVGLPWETVLAADTSGSGSRAGQGLTALVQRALPRVDEAVEAALNDAEEGGGPVLLTELAPLARYGRLGAITRWSDLSTRRRRAVWVLVPQLAGTQGAVVDGRPLQLSAPGQLLRIDSAWIAAG